MACGEVPFRTSAQRPLGDLHLRRGLLSARSREAGSTAEMLVVFMKQVASHRSISVVEHRDVRDPDDGALG
jgi:hypothetical protein